jgi:hypothetical protein
MRPLLTLTADSDEDDFSFDDASPVDTQLPLRPRSPTSPPLKISAFSDISSRLTHVLESLSQYSPGPPQSGPLTFVPIGAASEELSAALNEFAQNRDFEAFFSKVNAPVIDRNVAVQIDLIRFLRDPMMELGADGALDPRVLALVHFVVSSREEASVALSDCFCALEKFLESPDVAPIAILFPDFSLERVVQQLCRSLSACFPRDLRILPALNSFAKFVPTATELCGPLPALFDSDSGDPFEDLRAMRSAPHELLLEERPPENPLENCDPLPPPPPIVVPAAPEFVSFCLPATAAPFCNWLKSLAEHRVTTPLRRRRRPSAPQAGSYRSADPVGPPESGEDPPAPPVEAEDFLRLLEVADDPQSIATMPATNSPALFGVVWPLLSLVNLSAPAPLKRNVTYPGLIAQEFEAHHGLLSGNMDRIAGAITHWVRWIGADRPIVPVAALHEKRPLPEVEVLPPETLVPAVALSDMEIVLAGRSPLDLRRLANPPPVSVPHAPMARAGMLFAMYSETAFSPYVAFRIAFALALNVADRDPALACDLLFEGLRVLLEVFPRMARLPWVGATLLLFAELLERTDRYFYAALAVDAYSAVATDTSASKAIGQLCARNRDGARAMFHFAAAVQGLTDAGNFEEALFVARVMCAKYDERGLLDDAIGLLCGMLNRTFRLPIVVRILPAGEPGDRTLPPVRPKREWLRAPDPRSVSAQSAGLALANLLAKRNYFRLAAGVLSDMRAVAESQCFKVLIEFVSAKLHLRANRFEMFRTTLPQIGAVRSLASARMALFNPRTFDTAFASLKLLARGYLERGIFAKALFWAEAMIGAVQASAASELSKGHFLRGCALLEAVRQNAGVVEGIVVFEEPDQVMSRFAIPTPGRTFSRRELIAEALASFETTRAAQRRVGGVFLFIQASIAYVDALLYYFLDCGATSIVIGDPALITVPSVSGQRRSGNPPLTVTAETVTKMLRDLLGKIETMCRVVMHPLVIIAYQVHAARFQVLAHDVAAAKAKLNDAFSNLERYFMCSGQLVAKDLSLGRLNDLRVILLNLCHAIFHFDKEFINPRLGVFDMLASVETQYANALRLVVEDNLSPIDGSSRVRLPSVKALANEKYPTVSALLAHMTNTRQRDSDATGNDETIGCLLNVIRANIRSSEQQNIEEGALTNMNRALCRQIENVAHDYRRANPQFAVTVDYGTAVRANPMLENAVFVQRLLDSIIVYVPRSGIIRRVSLEVRPRESGFTVATSKTDLRFETNASLFSSDFSSLVALFLMSDKKLKHPTFNSSSAIKVCQAARETLFGDIASDFPPRPTTPDDGDFGERTVFGRQQKGHLISLQTSLAPIIIVASSALRALPYELMWPQHLVLRCLSFQRLMLPPPPRPIRPPKATVLRWAADAGHLMDMAIRRSVEEVHRLLRGYSPYPPFLPFVNDMERSLPFPFALFSSNSESSKYTILYPFCTVVNVTARSSPQVNSDLVILSYSDLSEVSALVERLILDHPFCFFLFIPCQFVREAFKIMTAIFERQERRAQSSRPCDVDVSTRAYDFVTLLQSTLSASLGCAIPLIAPLLPRS